MLIPWTLVQFVAVLSLVLLELLLLQRSRQRVPPPSLTHFDPCLALRSVTESPSYGESQWMRDLLAHPSWAQGRLPFPAWAIALERNTTHVQDRRARIRDAWAQANIAVELLSATDGQAGLPEDLLLAYTRGKRRVPPWQCARPPGDQ